MGNENLEGFDTRFAAAGAATGAVASLSTVSAAIGAFGSGSGAVAVTTGLAAIGGTMVGGVIAVAAGVLGVAALGTYVAGNYGASWYRRICEKKVAARDPHEEGV